MKYTVIKSKSQYQDYCNALEQLGEIKRPAKTVQDEMELLQLLIDTYDEAQRKIKKIPAHVFLKSLMNEHQMRGVTLANLLNVSPSLVSDMLHGKKAFSKNSIRILAEYFKVSQEAFNSVSKTSKV
ncbi:MAG: type II toxin-antitoxin system HigA family antitoxin [Bacteroidota bacterium]|jgi:HTH-type transcriptional regulator/antitoxin HigA